MKDTWDAPILNHILNFKMSCSIGERYPKITDPQKIRLSFCFGHIFSWAFFLFVRFLCIMAHDLF